jgi:hypothetical protein
VAGLLLLSGSSAIVGVGYQPEFTEYQQVIHDVHELAPASVVAPEDPTIPLFASSTITRNLYLEEDATGWKNFPDSVAAEIRRADYVVDVKGWWQDLLRPERLREYGFIPLKDYPHYTIWKR